MTPIGQRRIAFPRHPLTDRYEREHIRFHQVSEREWHDRQRILFMFLALLQETGRDFGDMTAADLRDFAGRRLATGRHINTVRRNMNMIRWFANWLYEAGELSADQVLHIRKVRNPRGSTGMAQPRPYSREDLDRFYAVLDELFPKLPPVVYRTDGKVNLARRSAEQWILRGRKADGWAAFSRHAMRLQIEAIVALALHCALRAGEIWTLTVDDLDTQMQYLVVKGKRQDQREKLREVPYTTAAREAVTAWLELRARLNPRHTRPWLQLRYTKDPARPMTRKRFYGLLTRLGKEWKLHRLRHTAATERLRAGTDIEIISRWLGHSNIRTTLGYLDIVKADIARTLARTEADFVKRIGPSTTKDDRGENPPTDIPRRAA